MGDQPIPHHWSFSRSAREAVGFAVNRRYATRKGTSNFPAARTPQRERAARQGKTRRQNMFQESQFSRISCCARLI